jgi:hypothetical protein
MYRKNTKKRHSRKLSRRNRKLSRRSRQGGLGDNDGKYIHIHDKLKFKRSYMLNKFKIFVFGNKERCDAWTTLLQKCKEKNVPVYILTEGNKIGIIRTLQLLGMEHFFREVLCTNPNEIINPIVPIVVAGKTNRNRFKGHHKYTIIYEILKEHEISCDQGIQGCLLDDDLKNSDNHENQVCRSIQFIHTKGEEKNPDPSLNPENKFFKLRESLGQRNDDMNFTPIPLIQAATNKVDNGIYNIVFIDFDKTFEIYDTVTSLHDRTAICMQLHAHGIEADPCYNKEKTPAQSWNRIESQYLPPYLSMKK